MIKGIEVLIEWLSGEWWMRGSKWIVLFEKNEQTFLFLHYFCLAEETPKRDSFLTTWLDAKAKPLATLNK